MKLNQGNRGTALLISMVIIIVVAGIGGSFFIDTMSRFRRQQSAIQADEAQLACDANLERVRLALFKYQEDKTWDWNDILVYCNQANIDAGGLLVETNQKTTNTGQTPNNVRMTSLIYLKNNYEQLKETQEFRDHQEKSQNAGYYTANDAPLPQDPIQPSAGDQVLFGRTFPFSEGGCHIFIMDNDDGDGDLLTDADEKLICVVTFTFDDGTQRQVETLLRLDAGPSNSIPGVAILANGEGRLNGNPIIQDDPFNPNQKAGSVHLNGNWEISGNPTITDNATATGTFTITGSPTIGGISGGGKPPIPVPTVDPYDLKSTATYIMSANGKIYNQGGVQVHNGSGGNEFEGWKFTGSSGWDYSGNSAIAAPATYYFEAPAPFDKSFHVKIGGSPGTKNNPAPFTLLSESSIIISGNPNIGGDYTRSDDVMMITGGDLELSGNPNSTFMGYFAAHEQVKINGNPSIIGIIVAEDADDRYEDVKDYSIQLSGNATVTYSIVDTGATTTSSVPIRVHIEGYRRVK